MLPSPSDLTVDEVAAKLRQCPAAVRRALREGRLAGYRIGAGVWRVPVAALEEYCRPAEVPAARRPRLRVIDRERRSREDLAYLRAHGF